MKYAFSFIVITHGLIHLLGYIKAFFETESSKQMVGVSKPIGAIWLVTFILFTIVAIQFITGKKWFYLAFIAVFISQILVFTAWQNTKFGTIANVLILIVGLSAFATARFDEMATQEAYKILTTVKTKNTRIVSETDLTHLPETVKKWMVNTGIIGKPKVQSVRLKQRGTMRTKPSGNWMPFEATQSFNVAYPAFVWHTKVVIFPELNMLGRDQLKNGKGKMLIKLAGLIPVVNISDNTKINQGAMLRYLAEICWFPSAALSDYIKWQSVDSNTAKATFTYKNKSVSGLFLFNDNGDFIGFEADRYYGGNKNSKLEKWQITVENYKLFNTIKIPSECKVTWKLKNEDFNWLNLEIIAIDYNKIQAPSL